MLRNIIDLIKKEKQNELKNMLDIFYRELMWLNIDLFFAQKLSEFPFEELILDKCAFLYTAYMTYILNGITIVSKLTDPPVTGTPPYIKVEDICKFLNSSYDLDNINISALKQFIHDNKNIIGFSENNSVRGIIDFCEKNGDSEQQDIIYKLINNVENVLKKKIKIEVDGQIRNIPIKKLINKIRHKYRNKIISHLDRNIKIDIENLKVLNEILFILLAIKEALNLIYKLFDDLSRTTHDIAKKDISFIPLHYQINQNNKLTDVDEIFSFYLKYCSFINIKKCILNKIIERKEEKERKRIIDLRNRAEEFFKKLFLDLQSTIKL